MQNQPVRDGFFFLGDHPALEFLNTKPLLEGQQQELLTDFPAVLRWLVAAGLLARTAAQHLRAEWDGTPQANAAMARILAFRESLRSAVLAVESSGSIPRNAIEEINRLLEQHPFCFQITGTGRKLTKRVAFSSAAPEDLIGILANAAADLLSAVDRTYIRKCETCVLQFRDTTKNHSRRWCSMQLCGNRAKVAAYAARNRRRQHGKPD
jgi:predicted RNA-binding Zn ribbon-like protein